MAASGQPAASTVAIRPRAPGPPPRRSRCARRARRRQHLARAGSTARASNHGPAAAQQFHRSPAPTPAAARSGRDGAQLQPRPAHRQQRHRQQQPEGPRRDGSAPAPVRHRGGQRRPGGRRCQLWAAVPRTSLADLRDTGRCDASSDQPCGAGAAAAADSSCCPGWGGASRRRRPDVGNHGVDRPTGPGRPGQSPGTSPGSSIPRTPAPIGCRRCRPVAR